ncbi:MAG: hypothetical protein EON84_02165 [Bradyrhizobiaceae bacterium]|nr:MAG: hypothetical protein EON84_02165 [Bradyrhizobiaceae bacterium]
MAAPREGNMSDRQTPSVTGPISEIASIASDAAKAAVATVSGAIEEGKKPGKPLDLLSKMTREAPLGMLLAAFLVGRAIARRR